MPITDSRSNTDQVQQTIRWRNTLTALPGNQFYDLVRMYLGEIKTPYNKQNLLEDLSTFIRRLENKQQIIKLLSDNDIQLLTAIHVLNMDNGNAATAETLSTFFRGVFSFAELHDRLYNLEERLLIFRFREDNVKRPVFFINPLLSDVILPLCSPATVLPTPETDILAVPGHSINIVLTPLLLACFMCFIRQEGEIRKQSGSIKKRFLTLLPQMFPLITDETGNTHIQFWLLLLNACTALGLFIVPEAGELAVDSSAWQQFAQLPEDHQYAYLCAAADGYISRSKAAGRAQLILNICKNIPEHGFSKSILRRFILLWAVKPSTNTRNTMQTASTGKFAALMRRHQNTDKQEQNIPDAVPEIVTEQTVDTLFDAMVNLGLVHTRGRTSMGETIYVAAPVFSNIYNAETIQYSQTLTVDASGTVTAAPGLSLLQLLELTPFLHTVQYDTAAVFEISRKSCISAFDKNYSPEKIEQIIQTYSAVPLPQSLRFSIHEWAGFYDSTSLYKGYVLKVSAENTVRIEKSDFADHILATLAPGVYLLDFTSDADAIQACEKIGLDYTGSIKTARQTAHALPFRTLNSIVSLQKSGQLISHCFPRAEKEERKAFLDSLEAVLPRIDMTEEQRDGLISRIHRKVILSPAQLRPDSVRPDKIQADSMDFLGKVRLVERAIELESTIEITFENAIIKGIPVSTEKTDGDVLVFLCTDSHDSCKQYSISKAKLIKRIRGSIFNEE